MGEQIDKYSKREVEFVTASFASGMRLAFVNSLEKYVAEKDIATKSLFQRIGQSKNASRFSQWKKHGVPKSDQMLGKILEQIDPPIAEPDRDILFHWGYRLAVVQAKHSLIEKNTNIKTCRGPLELPEYFYLFIGHEIAWEHGQNLNPALAEHLEIVHSLLPAKALQLIPEGNDFKWFSRLMTDFHAAFQIVVEIIGSKTDPESGGESIGI